MKKRFLSLLFVVLMLFNVCYAAPVSLNAKDLVKESSRTYIEFSSLKDYGLKTEMKDGAYTVSDGKASLVFKKNTNEFTVNGTKFAMDTKTKIKGNEFLIPLRTLFETLNYNVVYDQKTKGLKLEKNKENTLPVKEGNYTITKTHKKVASLAPSVTEIMFDLGAGDMLVTRTDYCNYPAAAAKITSVGSMLEPSIEKVIAQKPTVVIAETHFKEDVLNQLKKAGMEIIAFNTPNSMEETYASIKTIATIVDKNYEGRALISTMKGKLAQVSLKTKNLNKPSAYIVVGTGESGEFTHGKTSFMNEILNICGYTNAGQDADGFKYTLEKLIKKNPTYLLTPGWATETVKTGAAYKGLSAVKNGKVVQINDDIFSRASNRVVTEGLKELLKIAHPEVIKDLEF